MTGLPRTDTTRPAASPAADTQDAARLDTLSEAADWYALLQSDHADDIDRDRFQAWLNASTGHQAAWQHIERISARFQSLQDPEERRAARNALQAARQSGMPRRQLLGLLLAGGGALLVWQATRSGNAMSQWHALTADLRTGSSETRHVRLADGSDVWLNTGSALDTDHLAGEQRLRLYQGDILIETAHGRRHDFVVETRHGRLRALGTRYAVAQQAEDTLLSVFAGAVEVSTPLRTLIVRAGQQVRIGAAGPGRIEAADAFRESWARGILLADGMRLDTLLRELGRHHAGRLSASPAAATQEVLGTYPLQDTAAALDMLASVLPIRIVRDGRATRILLRDE